MRGGLQSAQQGFKSAWEERASTAQEAASPGFERMQTGSSLSKYGVVIILLFLGVGTTFYTLTEEWEWQDALYFCVTTMTTVGYGDLAPSSDSSKIFTIVYILLGLSIVATSLGLVAGQIGSALAGQKPVPRHVRHVHQALSAIATIFALIAMGAGFVYWSEGWEPLDAIYWAVVTAATVGYGDLTTENEMTRLFGVPYMLVAVGGFAVCLSKFGSIFMEIEAERNVNAFVARGVSEGMIDEMDEDGSGEIDKAEFLEYMLVTLGKVDQEDVDKVLAMFDELDVDGGGTIGKEDIVAKKKPRPPSSSLLAPPPPEPLPPPHFAGDEAPNERGNLLGNLLKPLLPRLSD